MTVEQDANVHETTVKDAQAHADAATPPKTRRKPRSRSSAVRSVKVDPRVMAAARKLAKGDMSRVRILSASEVVVTNPRPK